MARATARAVPVVASGTWLSRDAPPAEAAGVIGRLAKSGWGHAVPDDVLRERVALTLAPLEAAGPLSDVRADHAAVEAALSKAKGKWRRLLPHRRAGGRRVPSAAMKELAMGLPLDRLAAHVSDAVDLAVALGKVLASPQRTNRGATDHVAAAAGQLLNGLALAGKLQVVDGHQIAALLNVAALATLEPSAPFVEQAFVELALAPSKFTSPSLRLRVARALDKLGALAANQATIEPRSGRLQFTSSL